MPFRSGTLSVRRYVVQSELPATFARTATMAVRRYEFHPINADRGERESFGWVNPRAPLGAQFAWEDLVDGNLAFLAVRRDRKSFNKVIFKARLAELSEQTRRAKGIERLTRQHRLALEEQLTVQMLKEVTPATAFTELVWDLNTGDVFIGATSKSLCERITELFASTFDLRVAPQFPALLGYAWMAEQGLEDQFEVVGGGVTHHSAGSTDDESEA